jgi:hypothetical protein
MLHFVRILGGLDMYGVLKVILTVAAATTGLAILGELTNHAGATAPGAPPTSSRQVIESDTRLIQEGQFCIISFSVVHPENITVSVHVKNGPPIDSYFVGEPGLNAWQAMAENNQRFPIQYRTDLSMAPLVSRYSHTGLIQPGRYALIIDNSKLGATAPPFHFFKKSPALVAYTVSAD